MHQIKSLHILCIVGLFLSQVVDAMQQCVINIPGQFVEFSTTDDVNVAANEITLIEDQSVYLRNGFEISSSLGFLSGDSAVQNQSNNSLSSIQNASFAGSNIFINFTTGTFEPKSNLQEFLEGIALIKDKNLFISFNKFLRNEQSEINFYNTNITSCAQSSEGWNISAENIYINEKTKRGSIRNLNLELFDKTIFKLPYLPFPATTERLSGFLMPDISFSNDGLDFYIPIFLVTSESSDVTFSPRRINDRGSGVEINFRSRKEDMLNTFDLIYFSGDKKYSSNNDERWAFKLEQSFVISNLHIKFNWSDLSDSLLLSDIPTNLDSFSNRRNYTLPQKVFIGIPLFGGRLSVENENYISLNPFEIIEFKKAPKIQYEYFRSIGNSQLSIDFKSEKFSKPDILLQLFARDRLSQNIKSFGRRDILDLKIASYLYSGPHKFILNNQVILKNYDVENNVSQNNAFMRSYFAFERGFFSKTKTYKHNLGIEFGLGFANYQDQSSDPIFDLNSSIVSLLGDHNNEILGYDRIIDERFLKLGIKSSYKRNDLRNINKLFYKKRFSNSKVLEQLMGPLPDNQDFLMIKNKTRYKNTNFYISGLYDNNLNKFINYDAKLNYDRSQFRFFISKKFTRNIINLDINEFNYLEIGSEIFINASLNLMFGLREDLFGNQKIENFLGLGYENCCFAFRIIANDDRLVNLTKNNQFINMRDLNYANWEKMISLENKSRISFEFEFKGLTNKKNKISKLFNEYLKNF